MTMLSLPQYDYMFVNSSYQPVNGENDTRSELVPAIVDGSSQILKDYNNFELLGYNLFKADGDLERRYFEQNTNPSSNAFIAASAGDKIVFIQTNSPIKVRDFLNQFFPNGIICVIRFNNVASFENEYSWENLLADIWPMGVYYTPLNVEMQDKNRRNTHQILCPRNLVTAIEIKPTVWSLMECTIWYQSNRQGVINIPPFTTPYPVDNNPSIGIIEEKPISFGLKIVTVPHYLQT